MLLSCFLVYVNVLFGQNQRSYEDIHILDVNVIDVVTGQVSPDMHITISDGKIKYVSSTSLPIKSTDLIIEAKGQYIMPGLAEMHAHIPPPSTGDERITEVLFLYLSNGITAIRGMLGDSSHLALRSASESSQLLSPRIFTSSPSLNGNSVTSLEEADRKVRKYKENGYDFLKIHPGISRENFDQIVETANLVDIPFAGHVPVDVGIRHALKSRYASIDHVDGFIEGLVPASEDVEPTENGFFGYNFTPLVDTTLIDELVSLSRENEVWIVPTQSLFERWFAPVTADVLLAQPEMQYMPPATRRNWLRVKNQYMTDENFNEEQWKKFDHIRKKLINALSKDGHGILLGSDAPQLFNVPGFSIHHEIAGMQNAGMSNLEIIQAGTINTARFFNQTDVFGQVKEGLSADLILLGANPLENIGALREIIGVFRNGQFISKETIDLRLSEMANKYKSD